MSFSDNVGIKFLEIMSGDVGHGEFTFDLQLVIPSLRKFLDADLHQAQITNGTLNVNETVQLAEKFFENEFSK